MNQTFDEHFTQIFNSSFSKFKLYYPNATGAFVKNEEDFEKTIVPIIEFSGKILTKIQQFSGPEGNQTFKAFFQMIYATIVVKSNTTGEVDVNLMIYGSQGYKIQPILQIFNQHFGNNFTYYYYGISPPDYKITDFIAGGFTTPVILHDTKILQWKRTPFQQAAFVESKTLGKGLILDGITQYFERLTNYTNVFMKFVQNDNPKRILIIGKKFLYFKLTLLKVVVI